MRLFTCLWCKNEFKASTNKKRAKPKFCSVHCYREAPRDWIRPTIVSDEKKIQRLRKTFDKMVIKGPECWGWKGAITAFGYGKSSKYFKLWTSHRVSWFLTNGPIPKGKCVLHKCDNPICSNPDHLYIGDKKSNNNDRHEKGRDAKGSKGGNAKLDEKKVIKIKKMLKKGFSQDNIGKMFEIHQTQISNIKLGKTWSHVTC